MGYRLQTIFLDQPLEFMRSRPNNELIYITRGFIKKSNKTPRNEIEISEKYYKSVITSI